MHDPPDDYIVALRTVRKIAVGAVLDDFIVPAADKGRIPRTFLTEIEGTVAEHAVEVLKPFMTRKVLAIPIFKKTIGIFHLSISPCLLLYISAFFLVIIRLRTAYRVLFHDIPALEKCKADQPRTVQEAQPQNTSVEHRPEIQQ